MGLGQVGYRGRRGGSGRRRFLGRLLWADREAGSGKQRLTAIVAKEIVYLNDGVAVRADAGHGLILHHGDGHQRSATIAAKSIIRLHVLTASGAALQAA